MARLIGRKLLMGTGSPPVGAKNARQFYRRTPRRVKSGSLW
jgi:hypothetical protein